MSKPSATSLLGIGVICLLAAPAVFAQDAAATPAPATTAPTPAQKQSVMVKQTWAVGDVVTQKVTRSGKSRLALKNGDNVLALDLKVSGSMLADIEVLESNSDADPVKVKRRWLDSTEAKRQVNEDGSEGIDFGPGDSPIKGKQVSYERTKRGVNWTRSSEEQGLDDTIQRHTERTPLTFDGFLPQKEVKIGDSWSLAEQALIANAPLIQGANWTSAKGTCKVERYQRPEGSSQDYLMLAFTANLSGSAGQGNASVECSGHLLYDTTANRIYSVTVKDVIEVKNTQNGSELTMSSTLTSEHAFSKGKADQPATTSKNEAADKVPGPGEAGATGE